MDDLNTSPLDNRVRLLRRIEEMRGGRSCIAFFNFDRSTDPTGLPGLNTMFADDAKEALFRVLKESNSRAPGVDLCLYTRGGDTNAVWPIVSLIREFDQNFEVLVPFRCHSAGTLLVLGAKKCLLTPLSELSPIDPTCGNQFNPIDEHNRQRIGISVEDVTAYQQFIHKNLVARDETNTNDSSGNALLSPFLQLLTQQIHPLALGNVHRVQQQGRRLARELLKLHGMSDERIGTVVDQLSSKYYTHRHMINRHEAQLLMGNDKVEAAELELSTALDELLHTYEQDFRMRHKFVLENEMCGHLEKDVRFIGGAIESAERSYLFETRLRVKRVPVIPPNIQLQLQPGQDWTTVPGIPSQLNVQLLEEGWIHNTNPPQGVTT